MAVRDVSNGPRVHVCGGAADAGFASSSPAGTQRALRRNGELRDSRPAGAKEALRAVGGGRWLFGAGAGARW